MLAAVAAHGDLLHSGVEQARNRKWREAAGTLQRAVHEHPDSHDAWYWLGASQFYTQAFEAALKSLERARALLPSHSPTHRTMGLVYLQLERPNDAYNSWLRALELNPRDPETCYYVARLFFEHKVYDRAERWFRQTLEFHPGDHRALLYLGLTKENEGDGAAAVALFRKSIEKSKENKQPYAWAYWSLGRTLRRSGELAEARAVLSEGERIAPDARVLTELAQVLLHAGETEGVEALLRRAVTLEPEYAQARYVLAGVLRSSGRISESKSELAVFERLRTAQPRRVSAAQETITTSSPAHN
ncbi:MAG TPA: tetratricopeptide repeat protein [Bryobacteraceae bacterium]|nr:tetratricopeptide repeat protein [Bryobacteraceae bacterium]